MRRSLLGIGMVCLVVLAGCAIGSSQTIGEKRIIDEGILSQIKIGESTKEDVKRLLGEPAAVDFIDEGEKWTYLYAIASSKIGGEAIIPVIGMLLARGESKIQQYTLTILFNKQGIVEDFGRGQTEF